MPGDIALRPLVAFSLRGVAPRLKMMPHVLLLYDPLDRNSFRALKRWHDPDPDPNPAQAVA